MKEFLKLIAAFFLALGGLTISLLILPRLTENIYFSHKIFIPPELSDAVRSSTNNYSAIPIVFTFIIFVCLWRIMYVEIEHWVKHHESNTLAILSLFVIIAIAFFGNRYFTDSSQKSAEFTDGRELKINEGALELWVDGHYTHKVYKRIRYLSEERDFIIENATKVQTLGKNYAVLALRGFLFSKGDSEGVMIHRIVMYDIAKERIVEDFAVGTKKTKRSLDEKEFTEDNNDMIRALEFLTTVENETSGNNSPSSKFPIDFTVRGEDEIIIEFSDGLKETKEINIESKNQ